VTVDLVVLSAWGAVSGIDRRTSHRCGEPAAGKDAQPKQFQKFLFGENAVMPGQGHRPLADLLRAPAIIAASALISRLIGCSERLEAWYHPASHE
jgi:hypothetical protein